MAAQVVFCGTDLLWKMAELRDSWGLLRASIAKAGTGERTALAKWRVRCWVEAVALDARRRLVRDAWLAWKQGRGSRRENAALLKNLKRAAAGAPAEA